MTGNASTGFPGVPQGPMVGPGGSPSQIWYQFFVTLWNRTGGALGTVTIQLDTIANQVGSILFRASSGWAGLGIGAANKVLKVVGGLPQWASLDGASFPNQAASTFFASPSGAGGQAAFRSITTTDLKPVAGEFPGTGTADSASPGNVGEYVAASLAPGSAVAVTSGTPSDITSIALTAGDWDVWAVAATNPAAGTTTSAINAWINTASATDPGAPNNGAYLSLNQAIGAGLGQVLQVGKTRISIAANTTVYLSTKMTFATSTMGAYGFLGARRVR